MDHELLQIGLEYSFGLRLGELEEPTREVFHEPIVPNPLLFQHLKHRLQNLFSLHCVFLR